MKVVKVLHFSTAINRDDAIDTIIRYFPDKSIQIEAATLTPQSLIADTQYEEISIPHHRLSSKHSHTYLDYLLAVLRLYQIIRRQKIDIIHAHIFWVTIIATAAKLVNNLFHNKKLKLIIHRHYTHDIDYLPKNKRIVLKFLESISYRYADFIIVPTHTIKKVISSEYPNLIASKVLEIPYCFNFNAEKYREIDKECILNFRFKVGAVDSFVIVNVGSHRWQKGQQVLIKSFAEFLKIVPNAQLWLIGSGPQTEEFKRLAASLGLMDGDNPPCRFWGFKPTDQVKLFVSASDLFVHPTFSEAFPQVMIESLMWGTPLIITPVSGAVDYLEHQKHAWFVPINDPVNLTTAMVELWKNPELRSYLSKNGKELILSKFSHSSILPSYKTLYENLSQLNPSHL